MRLLLRPVFSLLAGTATTFSVASPLLADAAASILGIAPSVTLTIIILVLVAAVYTITVLTGMKAISNPANFCTYVFFALLLYVLIGGGEIVYIIETGITAQLAVRFHHRGLPHRPRGHPDFGQLFHRRQKHLAQDPEANLTEKSQGVGIGL